MPDYLAETISRPSNKFKPKSEKFVNNLSTLIVNTTHKALEVPMKKVEFEDVEEEMSSHSFSSSEESN